jgi:hypothetical protein
VSLVSALQTENVRAWFGPRAPVRLAGGFALVVGVLFYVLWLSEIVPAIAASQRVRC